MVTIQKILDYVTESPNNTNINVLRGLLENLLKDQPQAAGTVEELIEALEKGGNIQLSADIIIEGNEGITIAAETEANLDLNGYTLKNIVKENKHSQIFNNKGILIISDSSNGSGLMTNELEEGVHPGDPASGAAYNYTTNLIENNGTVTILGGKLINTANGSACYAVDNNSADGTHPVCYIKGGLLKNEFYTPVRVAPTNSNKVVLEMTDGVVEGLYGIVFNANSSSAPQMDVTISGGQVLANTYAFYSSAAGNINNVDNLNISISGGKFGNGPVTEDELISTSGIIGRYISGGLFTSDAIGDYVVDGCTIVESGDANYPWKVQ